MCSVKSHCKQADIYLYVYTLEQRRGPGRCNLLEFCSTQGKDAKPKSVLRKAFLVWKESGEAS